MGLGRKVYPERSRGKPPTNGLGREFSSKRLRRFNTIDAVEPLKAAVPAAIVQRIVQSALALIYLTRRITATASHSTWIGARVQYTESKKAAPITGISKRSATTRCFCSVIMGTAVKLRPATCTVPKEGGREHIPEENKDTDY